MKTVLAKFLRRFIGTMAAVNAIAFCQPPLKVESVTPLDVPTAGGIRVVVKGSGFMPGTEAWLGGRPLTAVQISADETELSGIAPAHAAGVVDVTLRTPAGQSTTLTAAAEYFTPSANGNGGARPGGGSGGAAGGGGAGGSSGSSGGGGGAATAYDVKTNIPLAGALAQGGINALAYATDSGQIITAQSGGKLTVFDFGAPFTTITQIRYVASGPTVMLSLPIGLTLTRSPGELLILDLDLGGPSGKRLHRVDRGADGLWGTPDDWQVSTTALPTSLSTASGVAHRATNGELFFSSGGNGGNPGEVVVTDSAASTVRRRFTLPTGFGFTRDLGFAGDQLMVVGSSAKLILMNPDTGVISAPAADPIAALTANHSLTNLGLSDPGGITAAGGASFPQAPPLFIANATPGAERVVVFVAR